jgi:hypothetical protein
MSKEQAFARAQTLAYLTVANLWLQKPQTVKDIVEK